MRLGNTGKRTHRAPEENDVSNKNLGVSLGKTDETSKHLDGITAGTGENQTKEVSWRDLGQVPPPLRASDSVYSLGIIQTLRVKCGLNEPPGVMTLCKGY